MTASQFGKNARAIVGRLRGRVVWRGEWRWSDTNDSMLIEASANFRLYVLLSYFPDDGTATYRLFDSRNMSEVDKLPDFAQAGGHTRFSDLWADLEYSLDRLEEQWQAHADETDQDE